jgi:hypothetical protein
MANCNSECEKTVTPFVQLPLGHSATTFSSSSLEMLIDRSYDLLKAEDGVAVNVISTEEMFLLTSFSFIVLTFSIMNNLTQLPDCLLDLEGHVRQYIELEVLQEQLRPILVVPSTHETVTHMGVRLATEREIQGRKDYLAEHITKSVVEMFRRDGRLSKCPELHTNRNET